jgi:hypothetical protein
MGQMTELQLYHRAYFGILLAGLLTMLVIGLVR